MDEVKDWELMTTPICQVEGREVISFLLGDSAYPLRPWILKLYKIEKQAGFALPNRFDRRWKVGRVKIGNAFGMLINKFRILGELNVGLPYAAHTVIAFCALQFLQDIGDINNKDLRDNEDNDNNAKPTELIILQEHRRA